MTLVVALVLGLVAGFIGTNRRIILTTVISLCLTGIAFQLERLLEGHGNLTDPLFWSLPAMTLALACLGLWLSVLLRLQLAPRR